MKKAEDEKLAEAQLKDKENEGNRSCSKVSNTEPENITPNKTDKPAGYFASMESLKSKRRKPSNTFKRREALNKKGWGKDDKQMTIDEFLVPKIRKQANNTRYMVMGCSDSFS